jgi:hypothetical protein
MIADIGIGFAEREVEPDLLVHFEGADVFGQPLHRGEVGIGCSYPLRTRQIVIKAGG